jgi:hypothetical protein
MVAGFAELLEREESLVAAACNHPILLVLPFNLALVRAGAQPASQVDCVGQALLAEA